MYGIWVMANDLSKLPKRVIPKRNNNEKLRLSAGLDLYLTLGHKLNDNSSIISNSCILLYYNSRVTLRGDYTTRLGILIM